MGAVISCSGLSDFKSYQQLSPLLLKSGFYLFMILGLYGVQGFPFLRLHSMSLEKLFFREAQLIFPEMFTLLPGVYGLRIIRLPVEGKAYKALLKRAPSISDSAMGAMFCDFPPSANLKAHFST